MQFTDDVASDWLKQEMVKLLTKGLIAAVSFDLSLEKESDS